MVFLGLYYVPLQVSGDFADVYSLEKTVVGDSLSAIQMSQICHKDPTWHCSDALL